MRVARRSVAVVVASLLPQTKANDESERKRESFSLGESLLLLLLSTFDVDFDSQSGDWLSK